MKKAWHEVTATLSYQRDLGTHISLDERPLWALLAERLGEGACANLTGHLFCCNIPEWTAKLRWGPEDEDGYTDKCVFHYMYTLGQWMSLGFGAWRHSRHIADIPVTPEWVAGNYPDAGWPWDGSELDEMHWKPQDAGA